MGLQEQVELNNSKDVLKATNWNIGDEMADVYWEQGVSQFWFN